MKKLYAFMIAIMATAILSSNIYAQADLAASADDYTVEESTGGYMINVNCKNVGNESYTGPVKISLAIYTLSGQYKISAVASISSADIAAGNSAGIGAFIHKDVYPYSTSLTPGTVYNIKVSLLENPDGNSANDESFLMNGNEKYKFYYYLDNPNAINDFSAENTGLNIYPNPVTNNATIQFTLNQNSNVSLKVYNAIGGLVKEVENAQLSNGAHQYSLNTASFEKGMYFYVLETNEGRVSKRFIKE